MEYAIQMGERLLAQEMLARSVDRRAVGDSELEATRTTGTTIGVTMLIRQAASLTEWTKSSYSAVNGDCVEVKAEGHCTVAVRDSKAPQRPALGFAPETWSAFVLGISHAG